jgi:alpha-L-rhamnosidase
MKYAEGELKTVKGVIKSAWKKENGLIKLTVTIPANTTAEIYIPTKDISSVKEGGKKSAGIKELKYIKQQDNNAVFEVGSGTYQFEALY